MTGMAKFPDSARAVQAVRTARPGRVAQRASRSGLPGGFRCALPTGPRRSTDLRANKRDEERAPAPPTGGSFCLFLCLGVAWGVRRKDDVEAEALVQQHPPRFHSLSSSSLPHVFRPLGGLSRFYLFSSSPRLLSVLSSLFFWVAPGSRALGLAAAALAEVHVRPAREDVLHLGSREVFQARF